MDLDNKLGLFLGLAIGDALGAPLEFQEANEPNEYLKRYSTGPPTSKSSSAPLPPRTWPKARRAYCSQGF